MPAQMPVTSQEALMKLLQQVTVAQAAPDANLDELTALQQQILGMIRKPMDTASPGSPAAGAAMNMGAGAAPPDPSQPAPGELSPMLAALMGQLGAGQPGMAPSPAPAAPGSFPTHGLMAGAPPMSPPNMDEVARMIAQPGGRAH